MLKVLIADDESLARETVKMLLDSQSDVAEVLEAEDGNEARRLVAEHNPDIVILDIEMPGISGIELARELPSSCPNNPLNIKATPGSEAPREDGTAVLPVLLEIPVGGLVLVPQGETHNASVAIFVSVKDKDGNPGQVQKIPFHLNIPAEMVEQAKKDTAHYSLPVVLRPGDTQVAISVRDDVNGTLSTVRVDISAFSQSF